MVAGGVDVLKKLTGEAKKRQKHPLGNISLSAGSSAASASSTPGLSASSSSSAPAGPLSGGRFFVSSNWKNLLEKRPSVAPKTAEKKTHVDDDGAGHAVVALDCEMVGVGADGVRSVLARVSIVDNEGRVLLDKLVMPREAVTDYRTHVTGISAATLRGKEVISDDEARRRAADILTGKIVVGHALQHDFQALLLSHPHSHIRDTSLFRPFRPPGQEKKTPSLKRLAAHWLHEEVQTGKHDSVEDAQIALRLYRLKSKIWEKQMRSVMRPMHSSSANITAVPGGAFKHDEEDEGEAVQRHSGLSEVVSSGKKSKKAKKQKTNVEATANPGKKKRKALQRAAEAAGAAVGPSSVASPTNQKRKRED